MSFIRVFSRVPSFVNPKRRGSKVMLWTLVDCIKYQYFIFQSTMRLSTHNIFTEVLGIYILQVAVIVKKNHYEYAKFKSNCVRVIPRSKTISRYGNRVKVGCVRV